jgi:hypothetical protein
MPPLGGSREVAPPRRAPLDLRRRRDGGGKWLPRAVRHQIRVAAGREEGGGSPRAAHHQIHAAAEREEGGGSPAPRATKAQRERGEVNS